MILTDAEKAEIKSLIDRGERLPPKYRLSLFADAPEVELVWQGKSQEVTNVALPFQTIEHIDEARKEYGEQVGGGLGLFVMDGGTGRQASGSAANWTNKLIWGDNKLVLSSLKNGPLRREIEDAGGLKLIYIDPPFDVGADFSVNVEVGDDTLTKEPSVIEELAYRDTWGRGTDSYLSMVFERLKMMRDLLADDGGIYIHCDWRVNSAVRMIADEVFGKDHFRNEIIWYYRKFQMRGMRIFTQNSERILWYVRNKGSYIYNAQVQPLDRPKYLKRKTWDRDRGVIKNVRDENGKLIYDEYVDEKIDDVWDVAYMGATSPERTGYVTQKPEELLERVVKAGSNEGDLVADFFCGSGTTLAVAEKLGRKWIGCDLGRFALHTTRKRLIGVQRDLKADGRPYRSFEILNLGKYERQYFVSQAVGDPGSAELSREEREKIALQKEEHYVNLILSAYKAERIFQMPPFHGKKGAVPVVVGPIDAPVTLSQVQEVVAACRKAKLPRVDILGFEFEMGLSPAVQDEAKEKGVSLALRYIPKDVFDRRAVEKGQVQFYDVAYVELLPKVSGRKLTVTLKDFGVFYRQDGLDAIAEKLKPGGSRVTVENGQVVKVSKDKKGVVKRERLTKVWTDWIDYWAVDFDFESRKEIIRVLDGDQEVERWTGNFIFENEWQSYRTRKDRKLELTSGPHEYPKSGKYKIAVKVIDIFGNDTTKVAEVKL